MQPVLKGVHFECTLAKKWDQWIQCTETRHLGLNLNTYLIRIKSTENDYGNEKK